MRMPEVRRRVNRIYRPRRHGGINVLELHDKRDPVDGRREKPNGGGEDMKYTKGPWRIDSDVNHQSETIRHSIVSESGRLVAWILKHYDRDEKFQKTSEHDDADAALIAAAPELLRNLKNMVREWEEIIGTEEENKTPGDTLEHAKAAIAAAEGRS